MGLGLLTLKLGKGREWEVGEVGVRLGAHPHPLGLIEIGRGHTHTYPREPGGER